MENHWQLEWATSCGVLFIFGVLFRFWAHPHFCGCLQFFCCLHFLWLLNYMCCLHLVVLLILRQHAAPIYAWLCASVSLSVCFVKKKLCVRSLGYIVVASPPLCVLSFGNTVGASPPRVCPFIGRQSSLHTAFSALRHF